MSIAAPPPMPSVLSAEAADHGDSTAKRCGRGRACAKAGARKCTKMASSPTRGLVVVMVGATVIATILAVIQLSQGAPGRMAGNTLFAAAGFNLLFTAMYAPLLALFTIRSGVCRSVGTFFSTIFKGLAFTLSLLFISVAVLVGLGVVFG
ncbi:MAG: hypothetical protein NCW75_01630 [Phycisphaera sp.]|nr:MAG: hypothetical protein NCW75_01630 [Phycisphaera sp.]